MNFDGLAQVSSSKYHILDMFLGSLKFFYSPLRTRGISTETLCNLLYL